MDELDGDVDWEEQFAGLEEDWEVIERVLPVGWQEAARRTGALRRTRGFKDAANRREITIRHVGGEAETFNYQDVISGKNTQQNILLKSGDIIIVK